MIHPAGQGTEAVLRLLEARIEALARTFQSQPFAFFSERELHGEFFGLCREAFGHATPHGTSVVLPLFRHEYNNIWRYQRAEPAGAFTSRRSDGGRKTGPGSLDFAILRRTFVESNVTAV